MKPLGEILNSSLQKKALDHTMNMIADNTALASHAPLFNLDGPVVKNGRVKGPRNERDELFDYFFERLAGPYKRFAKKPLRKAYLATKIAHLKVHDLHYIKSLCVDAQRRGIPPSKVFWGSLKPRPEDVHN